MPKVTLIVPFGDVEVRGRGVVSQPVGDSCAQVSSV